ncbi:MAG TPA: SAM-dependent chlorinase/fluorinase, partial [Candidatus Eremiobacteraeota bacterium]|nr:SAM-dependent chlorinase/fluorinase [Candidatus Eremiobacteraeota bacterium]
MKENYLIAVLTDFGMKDGFVGTMKGVIYGINPLARIVDISHEISPQNLLEASFILKSSVDYFPVNTVFLVVVDPGVGSSRRNIILKTPSFLYVSPDNGVLSRIYREEKEIDIIEITNSAYFLRELSNTFYGRDLFAPVSAHLSLGVDPYLMGNKIHDPVIIPEILPVCHKNKA